MQVEHSGDGRNWVAKQTVPEVGGSGGAAILAGQVSTAYGYDNGTLPSLPFVRLKVRLTTTTSAHVKVYATGRDHAQPPRLRILDTVAYAGGWALSQHGYHRCMEHAATETAKLACKQKYLCHTDLHECRQKAHSVEAKQKCYEACDDPATNSWALAIQQQQKLGVAEPLVATIENKPAGSPNDADHDDEDAGKKSPWDKN